MIGNMKIGAERRILFQPTVSGSVARLRPWFAAAAVCCLTMLGAMPAVADTGVPASIVATDLGGGSFSFSGSWSWPGCSGTTKLVGFAMFESPNTPATPGASLDALVHVIPDGCQGSSGSWGPNVHALSPGSHTVCVVVYDVRASSMGGTGSHSDDPDGADRNVDSSWDQNGGQFGSNACTLVEVSPPTPTPTNTAVVTNTPTTTQTPTETATVVVADTSTPLPTPTDTPPPAVSNTPTPTRTPIEPDGSLVLYQARLRYDDSPGANNGKAILRGLVDDNDTGGGLEANLLANNASIEVTDSGVFSAVLPISGCAVKKSGIIKCKSADKTIKAIFKPSFQGPLIYLMRVKGRKLADVATGAVQPAGPRVGGVLVQGSLGRADVIGDVTSCAAAGTKSLKCKEQ